MHRRFCTRTAGTVVLAGAMIGVLASPASAGEDTRYGRYPNGVNYAIQVAVYSGDVTGYLAVTANYTTGSIAILQCSGGGDCSARIVMASSRNYYTNGVATGNPNSPGHTYRSCASADYPDAAPYSNYCNGLAANSGTPA